MLWECALRVNLAPRCDLTTSEFNYATQSEINIIDKPQGQRQKQQGKEQRKKKDEKKTENTKRSNSKRSIRGEEMPTTVRLRNPAELSRC